MSSWLGLVHAELVKLRHLVVFRAVAGSLLLGPGVVVLTLRLVASDIRTVVSSPGEIVLGTVVLLAAFGAVVLASAMLGREFDQGTARMQLLRGTPRAGLMSAKLAVSLLALTAASLVASLFGIGETMLARWAPSVRQAADVVGKTVVLVPLVSLVYVAVAMLGTTLGRSTAAGVLVGLLLFLGDFLLSTLRSRIPFGEWMPVNNLFVLLGETYSSILPAGDVPTPGAATLRLAGVGLALILGATWAFERQDVTG